MLDLLADAPFPVVATFGVDPYIGANDIPAKNITGLYNTMKDMVYNSYKFLNKVAPLQPGQQAVFLENRQVNIITKDAGVDALTRLHIPVKAVVDATIFEDWQDAILKYNDDPDVGWIMLTIWPKTKRDGSEADQFQEDAVWVREHLKKPTVTYWEVAVQHGALCGFGMDINANVVQTARLAVRILQGEPVAQVKAEYPQTAFVTLNRKTADVMGIIFPPDVLSLANVIYHDWDGKEVTRKSGL